MGKPRLRLLTLAASLLASVAAAQTQTTSNFASVGFDVATGDEAAFAQSVIALAGDCDLIPLDEDDSVCLRQNETGGQIWISLRNVGKAHEFVAANPGFVGQSAFPVLVQGLQSDAEWEPFEYRLAVTFSDYNIPLLVELADPRDAARFRDLAEPVQLSLDLTAFTFNPEIFEDEEAFVAAQRELGEDVTFTPNYFIPSGLMGDTPSARA
ncbi:MAG: hypothetical protein AAFN48_07215, partial [Pseudomonadota bacterium]